MNTFDPSFPSETPTELTRLMTPEQTHQFLLVIERWRQTNKNSFLNDFTLLLDGALRLLATMPAEIENGRIDWQDFHVQHLGLLKEEILTLIAGIRTEGEALTQHWDYATHERNESHKIAQQMFVELRNSVEKLSRTDRERETTFNRMMTERDKQQTAWLNQREHEIVEKGKQNLAKTKWYCAGVTILAIAYSGLFCLSQIHEKRLIALQANAEIQTKVEEQIRRVEPTAYRMALEIVKNSRQVRLADGIDAWEVDLPVSAGIVSSSIRRDEQNAVKAICLFMRDNPERVTLEALAASAKKEKGQNAPK